MNSKASQKWIPVIEQKPATTFILYKLANDMGKEFWGWWTGQEWDGEKKQSFGTIIAWRKDNIYKMTNVKN